MTETETDSRLLDRPTAADALRVSLRTLDRLITQGRIRSIHIGRRHFVTSTAVKDFIQTLESSSSATAKP